MRMQRAPLTPSSACTFSPEQEFETARKRSEEVLEAFCVDQLYAMDDGECPDDYTPTTWIADARKDELRERFSALIQPELSWAVCVSLLSLSQIADIRFSDLSLCAIGYVLRALTTRCHAGGEPQGQFDTQFIPAGSAHHLPWA
jgi:hypothetical protein